MYNVNFGSTFLQVPLIFDNPDKDIHQCIDDIQQSSDQVVEQWISYDKKCNLYLNFIIEDKFDENVEAFLKSRNINFKKLTNKELFEEENIKSRLRVNPNYENELTLVELYTQKINDLYRKDEGYYIGDYPDIEKPERYYGFKNYIKTGKPIDASMLYLRETDKGLVASFQDGSHRYAVMRDMGFKKIPFAIDKNTYELAKKYNLL